jgi:hypothetical protein
MNRRAITRIDLLVAVVVPAFLLAVIVPVLGNTRKKAGRGICAWRIRQIWSGAVGWAEQHDGVLPQGGIHGVWGNTEDFDFDDGTAIEVEEYFKIGAGLIGIDGDFAEPMPVDKVEEMAEFLHEGLLEDIFVCPNIELSDGPYFPNIPLPRYGNEEHYLPFIHGWGISPERWTARPGYMYLAGFETEKWPEAPTPSSWWWQSPATLSDPGNLVLLCDRNRWIIEPHNLLELVHTKTGMVREYPDTFFDPRDEYPKARTNIGYLDGSVSWKKISKCEPRQYLNIGLSTRRFFTFF